MVENKALDYLDDETPPPTATLVVEEEEEAVNLLSFDAAVVEPPTLISAIQTNGRGGGCGGHLNSPAAAGTTPLVTAEEDEAGAQEKNRVIGAGIASGVVGLLLGGPFLALIFGFGAAYAAQQEGAVGDSARAVGEVALAARVKAREIDEKHHVVERAKVAGTRALEKAAEMDQKHGIVEKTTNMVVVAWNKTREFVIRHRLIERGIDGIGKGVYWLATKINEKMKPPSETTGTTTNSNGNEAACSSDTKS